MAEIKQQTNAPAPVPTEEKEFPRLFVVLGLTVRMILFGVAFLCFVFGSLIYDGNSITLSSAINLIWNLGKSNIAFWYIAAADLIVGATYCIGFVIAIKKLVVLIKDFIKALSKKNNPATNIYYLNEIKTDVFGFISFMIVIQMISDLVSDNALSSGFIFLLVFTGICDVGTVMLDYPVKNEEFNILDFILRSVKSALSIISVFMLVGILNKNILNGFATGIKTMIGGNIFSEGDVTMFLYNIYSYLIVYILCAVLAIMIIVMCCKWLDAMGCSYSNVRKNLIFIAVLFCIDIAINVIYKGSFSFSMLSSEYCAIYIKTATALAAFMVSLIPAEKQPTPQKKPVQNKQ